jgi:hypothetical protein
MSPKNDTSEVDDPSEVAGSKVVFGNAVAGNAAAGAAHRAQWQGLLCCLWHVHSAVRGNLLLSRDFPLLLGRVLPRLLLFEEPYRPQSYHGRVASLSMVCILPVRPWDLSTLNVVEIVIVFFELLYP